MKDIKERVRDKNPKIRNPAARLRFTALKIKRKNKTEGNKWSEIVRFKVIKGE